jgi:hypothetical protein
MTEAAALNGAVHNKHCLIDWHFASARELVKNTRKYNSVVPPRREFSRLQPSTRFVILLQRGIADFLSVMPRPFLGVSSLNLAAPSRSGHFFNSWLGE